MPRAINDGCHSFLCYHPFKHLLLSTQRGNLGGRILPSACDTNDGASEHRGFGCKVKLLSATLSLITLNPFLSCVDIYWGRGCWTVELRIKYQVEAIFNMMEEYPDLVDELQQLDRHRWLPLLLLQSINPRRPSMSNHAVNCLLLSRYTTNNEQA